MQEFNDFAIKNYNQFCENKITERRFKHKDLIPLIQKLESFFEIKKIGKSFENREIFRIKVGSGKTKILLWSQMHGNESVATLAILDILNFFKNPDHQKLIQNISLYFIPMLNPDGAEKFKRRNAQDIDLNRDALRQSAPESRILLEQIAELKPDFGFNLHDQEIYYGVEKTSKNTNIAFLAPAYNYEKSINESRKKSMQVIVSMNNRLQKIIPNSVAKYSDAFMPNAFGDNIQKLGTSTILIESGYSKADTERQFIRKLNFISIIEALYSIENKFYMQENIDNYFQIPANRKDAFFDYLLKNVTIQKNNKKYKTDIGISRNKADREDFTDYEKDFLIWEIGDLSNYNGFEEIDLEGKIITDNEGKIMKMKKADFLLNKI